MIGHITQQQWNAHPSFRNELKELLRTEAFRAALQILIAKGLQTKPLIGGVPCDLVQYSALMGQRKEGYFEALDNLEALTESAAPPQENLRAWYNPERDKKPTSDTPTPPSTQ